MSDTREDLADHNSFAAHSYDPGDDPRMDDDVEQHGCQDVHDQLPIPSRIECGWCGQQFIVLSLGWDWEDRQCDGCGKWIPKGDWTTPEDDFLDEEPVRHIEDGAKGERASISTCGTSFTYELDLTLDDEDEDGGTAGDRRAGWCLVAVEFTEPAQFLKMHGAALVEMLGDAYIDPYAGYVIVSNWYASRVVLAAAWIAQRAVRRAEQHAATPYLYLPFSENVHIDRITLRWLADLVGVKRFHSADFAALEPETHGRNN